MIYLVATGWEWFAAALALGLVVGALTTTRAAGADVRGKWGVGLMLFALAGMGAASALGALSGREGLLLDIALLASLAYFLGLPLGGGLKSLVPAAAPAAPSKPKPILLSRPPQAARAPLVDAPGEAPDGDKPAPGAPPPLLAGPRDGTPDDLSRIKGVGPKSIEKLHALGVFHIDQIAAWNIDNARWIDAAINAPGRVERDKWIQQARGLVAAAKTEQLQERE